MRTIAAILTTLALTGCAAAYTKYGATQAQIDRDSAECSYEAKRSYTGRISQFDLERDCMALRGYEFGGIK